MSANSSGVLLVTPYLPLSAQVQLTQGDVCLRFLPPR
jgi:hypothetical protein